MPLGTTLKQSFSRRQYKDVITLYTLVPTLPLLRGGRGVSHPSPHTVTHINLLSIIKSVGGFGCEHPAVSPRRGGEKCEGECGSDITFVS